jgi:hypothetical protein
MKIYIQKAMKSASEWNSCFIKERKEERRAYFDQQTFVNLINNAVNMLQGSLILKTKFIYSQTCLRRSLMGNVKSDLSREMTS